MSIAQIKKSLRQELLKKRKALSNVQERAQRISASLCALEDYQQAQKILFYASFGSEVPTFPLLQKALAEGKEVYLPRTLQKERRLVLHRLFRLEELRPGAYGIPEPPPENPTLTPGEIELIVVPGVGFDRKGGRLGYGGGFYDRLFLEAPKARRVALAFSCQLLDTLPQEPHDQRLDIIITEEEIIFAKRG